MPKCEILIFSILAIFFTKNAPWKDDFGTKFKKISFWALFFKFFCKDLVVAHAEYIYATFFVSKGKTFYFLWLLLNSIVSGQNDLFNFWNIFGFSIDYTIFLRTLSMPKKRKWRLSASIFKIIGFINVKNRDKKSHKRAPLRIYVHLNILVLNVWIGQKWREVSFLLYYRSFPDTSYTKTGSLSQEVLRCGGRAETTSTCLNRDQSTNNARTTC